MKDRSAKLGWQGLTVGWMLIEGAVAIGASVVAHSVALTAFGFDSFIELFSAGVVLASDSAHGGGGARKPY